MASLRLTLETVTPLLMYGSDKQKPDIRAASFRGGLRYWLRAVLGGIYQGDIAHLKDAESALFGSTAAGSPLRVQVYSELAETAQNFVLPPTVKNKRDEDVPHTFAGFRSHGEESLLLVLESQRLRRVGSVFTMPLYAGLALAFHLGAFGKRSRRGGGVLRIVQAQPDFPEEDYIMHLLTFQPHDGAEMVAFLNESLLPFVEASQVADHSPGRRYAGIHTPQYPVWMPEYVKVLVGQEGYADKRDVKAGKWSPPYQEGYRAALQDLWNISGALSLHHLASPHNPWGYAKGNRRRASAVHLRVFHGTDGLYYPLVTMFHSKRTDTRWNLLEGFDQELQRKGYQRIQFCTGAWR